VEGRGVLPDVLKSLQRQVYEQLALATSIKHRGESGRAREQIVANYLSSLLPETLAVSTGFVIDAKGDISRQIDLVIYRNDYHPVFEIRGIKHFLIESVVAVIENKAWFWGDEDKVKENLQKAFQNIASVKRLDRTNKRDDESNAVLQGLLTVPHGQGQVWHANREEDIFDVFGGVLVERSPTADTVLAELARFLGHNDIDVAPNFYAALGLKSGDKPPAPEDAFFVGYQDHHGELTTNLERVPDGVFLNSEARPVPMVIPSPDTLLRVGGKVVAATRCKPIIDFSVDSYFFDLL
jgi:hypothetical protein